MFETNDEAFLKRQISENNCMLFLGAGFLWGMRNRLNQRPPLGGELARELWTFLGYTDPYPAAMNLSKVFQLATKTGTPRANLRAFLEDRLLITEIPDKYNHLVRPFWYRIYTVNIDDSVPILYRRASAQVLDETVYPSTRIQERDQFLDRAQCVYLHGRLPCSPDDLTFSIRQYAKRAGHFDRLYDVFVGDYSTHTTIFLGTELDEPVFFQYLEAREGRGETAREHRPRSFFISPSVQKATIDLLDQFNVVAVSGTTDDFLSWLGTIGPALPSKDNLLEARIPTYAMVQSRQRGSCISERALKEFSASFHAVPSNRSKGKDRSKYLLGSSPRWEDLHDNLDAPRDITARLVSDIEDYSANQSKILVTALLGSAGCGKSTILRRLGLTLTQRGHQCYLSNCEDMPQIRDVISALEGLTRRAILLFDNAEGALGYISKLAVAAEKIPRPPIFLVASRANDFFRKFSHVSLEGSIREEQIPNLNRQEIDRLLKTLEANGLLGQLRGMTYEQRVREFSIRSGKQILVAMREATEGRGFDEIIRGELESLESEEAKTLYLCVALCTAAGYRVDKSEFVRCARVEPSVALEILEKHLASMVVRTGAAENLLLLRHRRIAEYLVGEGASRSELATAYDRLLPVLVPTGDETTNNTRRFKLYRELINHQSVFERFTSRTDLGRDIYDVLKPLVSGDVHYYLQYGCFEMQLGEFDFSTNYLHQARGLDPGNRYVINAQGQLLLKRAVAAGTKEEATRLRAEGKALLVGNFDVFGHYDAHYYSILASQDFQWIKKWCSDTSERAQELEELRDFLRKGVKEFARSKELGELTEKAREEYLRCAIR